ncbi:MAG: QueG-associated DUF1730 domain-containing protein [Terracidiphilus sp.]
MNNTLSYAGLEKKVPLGANANNSRDLLASRMRELALEAGFTEAGVAALPHADEERNAQRFREWVAKGRAGSMQYLERAQEDGRLTRESVRIPFPWVRSVVVCFASYASPEAPLSTKSSSPRSGWIARYGWSSRQDEKGEQRASDYHKVLLKRLRAVEARLHEEFGEFESRAYVDTGPIVERPLAVAAGLGWTGKNTCLIHPQLGSWGFLAVLLTSLDVSELASQRDSKSAGAAGSISAEHSRTHEGNPFEIPDRCGTCTRCIEACPTHALDVPYQMDATKCIAYLTIEHKGPIAEELMSGMGRQVFGCDICQDVCPWNGKALRSGIVLRYPTLSAQNAERMGHASVDAELEPRTELINPALDWLGSLDEKTFEQMFNGSPVRRAGFRGLQRNVAIAMGNSGVAEYVPKLEEWAQEADEGLRAGARWALTRLRKQTPP